MQKTKQKNWKKINIATISKENKKTKKCLLLGPHGLNTTRNPSMGQDSGPQ